MKIFGPIPSRRLGRSLGINNIPPKACSYHCNYCQVGPTLQTEIERRHFYGADHLVELVTERVTQLRAQGELIDYLSFVPDGEPTLDIDLGETIDKLRPLGIKIAVITNGSLIWHEAVRNTLKIADWVSLKVDSVDEAIWSIINMPHPHLKLATILEGMIKFAQEYQGTLVTETMLVKGINVDPESAIELADFIKQLKPSKAYFLIPTRPPALPFVRIPSQAELNLFYPIVSSKLSNIEYLTHYEGNTFTSTGDVAADLLSITAVHPLREEAVRELLAKNQADWSIVASLVQTGQLMVTEYEGNKFYTQSFQTQALK
jgi:wyosine [tRNA(Phe)-imidazoG37] synthetase (radical SAM superfamily)